MAHDYEATPLQPEEAFTSSLPGFMENIEPAIGYRVELVGVPLEKTFGTAAAKSLEATLGSTLEGTADLLYLYQPRTGTIDPTVLRFPLRQRITSVERAKDKTGYEVLADSIYLQRWDGGYIQTYGLGDDTMAAVGEGARELPSEYVDGFLSLAGLNSLTKEQWSQTRVSEWLGYSADWAAREQKLIPLPADKDGSCNQIILSRRRAVQTYPGEPTLHKDDYEVTFARVSPPAFPNAAPGEKTVDEETLRALHNDASGRTLTLVETRYLRYDPPLVPDLPPEISDEVMKTRRPEADDYVYFLGVLGAFASDVDH